VFTVFSTGNLVYAQIHWVLRLQFTRSKAGTHELSGELPGHPAARATAKQPVSHSSLTTVYGRGAGVGRILGVP
jgi:hypothetical protein